MIESPVEKVIKLLEDLKKSVEEEAAEEAKTYDTFACFCKDNTEERSDKITDGQSTIDENAATIGMQTQDKEQAERDLKDALDEIEKISKEIKDMETKRAKEKAEYDAVQADLSKAVDSIENAITALTPKLLQVSSLSRDDFEQLRKTIRKSAALADMLGVKPKLRRAVNALMQTSEEPETPENDYEFHSQEILDVLEELKKDFQANLDEKIAEGDDAKKAHDELMKTKQEELEGADGKKTDSEEAIEECKRQITEATEALVQAEKDLKDDQGYLKDLTERCESKAKEWDQRSTMRGKEVEAITKALEIIKEGAKGKLPEKKDDFLQQSGQDALPTAVQPEPHRFTSLMEDDVGDLGLVFMQETQAPRARVARLLQNSRSRLTPEEGTAKAVAALASEAKRLNSAVLEAFVTNISADPFKKVKVMIHGMIEKLMAEAADEANHKGFCDAEIAKAVGNRDNQNEKKEGLMAKLADLDVTKEKLTELIETTEEDLKTLQEALDKAKKMREEEKEENAMTLKDAKQGLEAIKSAVEMLEEFYRGAQHVKVFVQRGVEDDLPEGSANKGAYKGNQEGGRKVIAMLKEVQGNFEEAIKEVEGADAESRRQFVNFDRKSKVSIKEKETGKLQAESDLKSTEIAIVQAHEDLSDTQKMLDSALKEIKELKPACDVGSSFKVRAEAREKEIGALKKAICILDATAGGEDIEKCSKEEKS